MFNVKMTKNGSLAVILPNTEESKRVILSLLSGTLCPTETLPLIGSTQKVSDIEKFETARSSKLLKKQITASYDYEKLTPEQRMWEDQRYDITAAIVEYSREIGKPTDSGNIGTYYTTFYAKLRAKTGYAPARKTILEYYNPYVATKINTILKDGKGPDMLRVINQEIRSLTPRLSVNLKR